VFLLTFRVSIKSSSKALFKLSQLFTFLIKVFEEKKGLSPYFPIL